MHKNLNKKIALPSINLIASGRQRACYQHPEYDDLCVKIHLSGRDDKETLREVRYYKRLYKKKSPQKPFLITMVSNKLIAD